MARLIAHGAVLVVVLACAISAHAEEESDSVPADTATVAERFGINAVDLWGAVVTTKAPDAMTYLCWVGEGPCPKPTVVPAVTAQVLCIENKESGGANVWRDHTPPPPGIDKPGGVMQYFGSTFSAHAAEIGHPDWSRWVPWQAEAVASHDLAMERRLQWTVSGC